MADTLLAIKGVTAGYGNATVLRNVSLEVPKGALVSIIGPNGHGKTTLLRTISGMLRPTRGEITLNGQSLGDYRVDQIVAMGVAHIPQGDFIFSEMTIRDNLLMGAYLPHARARVDRSLQEVFGIFPRLKERQTQIASTLSGGERRMLSIGRGMMLCGQIMLIDEPSLGLAPLAIDVIYKVIKALKDEGAGRFFSWKRMPAASLALLTTLISSITANLCGKDSPPNSSSIRKFCKRTWAGDRF